ncbi:MAG: TRAP-type C4-dicarboxylate transport system substrate-binding protein [Gammaproteobacteria bacterium]|jgi:TRAP-type C4-dicarboxylate transport system substrate-binding protein
MIPIPNNPLTIHPIKKGVHKINLMNKTSYLLLTILVTLGLLQSAYAKTLKIATLAPAGTAWMKEMKQGAKIIEKKTNGRVKFKFYPGGVMGNDQSVHRKIKIGQLQGGAFTSGGLSHIDNTIQTYSLPMQFRSNEEVSYVREKMDSTIIQSMADNGFIILGLTGGGFARILSQKPLKNLESIRASKVWIPEGDTLVQQTFETLGISPVSLPISDVFTGLQTGLIETVTVNPTGAIAFQWHTSTSHMTETPVIYLMGILAVQKKAFDKLSKNDQVIVVSEMKSVYSRLGEINRSDDEKARKALVEQGIKFIEPGPEELERWRSLSQQSIVQMVEKNLIKQEIVDQINQHLKDYRNQ